MSSQLKLAAGRLSSGLASAFSHKDGFASMRRLSGLLDEGGHLINRLTGYDQCERLRDTVNASDNRFQELKTKLNESRTAFTKAITARSLCQKELNGLLQRKPSWLDTDLQRFTELYRAEMRLEAEEAGAREANEQLERQVDEAHHGLVAAMRERYQQEQLWSDKIRRASTFGTFGLMLVNILLFASLQLYVEPRKRQQYIAQIENVLMERLEKERQRAPIAYALTSRSSVTFKEMLAGASTLVLLNTLILFNFR